MDIPLLFEQDYSAWFDETWLVYVDRDVQVERLMKRDHLSKDEAEFRREKERFGQPCFKQQWKSGPASYSGVLPA